MIPNQAKSRPIVVHLTASTFFGGPERQMVGLARALRRDYDSHFWSFAESGRSQEFINRVAREGFSGQTLRYDTPRLVAATRELRAQLRAVQPAVLICHGYKSNILGRRATRHTSVPCLAVSRGWTAESTRIKIYELLDRRVLRRMDRVICVSAAQADKVRESGVARDRVKVIANAIDSQRFCTARDSGRAELLGLFDTPPRLLVGAAGRLSPEKGFDVLVQAASVVCGSCPDVGFVIFGDGVERARLETLIEKLSLEPNVTLPGHTNRLDELMASFDAFALASHTEGLPNVVLEALAARTPVVATAVGGTPEVLQDGVTGWLVPPGDPAALANGILRVLGSDRLRERVTQDGYDLVTGHFGFESQAATYRTLIAELAS